MSEHFYKALKGFDVFAGVNDIHHYVAAPADWYAVVTDIRGSTRAIAEGHYKDVNLAGAAVIASVLNALEEKELPYAFGGDGATLLVPPHLLEKTLAALGAVHKKVEAAMHLDLRAGCARLQDLYDEGGWLKISKFNLSPQMSQAVFQGNALSLAESWLKKGSGKILCPAAHQAGDPDLAGLKCRWKPVASRNGKVVSLMVRVTDKHWREPWRIYGAVLKEIMEIYPDFAGSTPAPLSRLGVSFSLKELSHEARLRSNGNGFLRALWLGILMFINAFNQAVFLGGSSPGRKIGARYLAEMAAHSDARKFDEMLRMVIDSSEEQLERLKEALDARESAGDIVYGIFTSDRALMTCLVFSTAGNHVHFIDGADGGYALAAKDMKRKIRG